MTTALAERWTARPDEYWDPATPPHRRADGSHHFHRYRDVQRVLEEPSLQTDWFDPAERPELIPVMAGLWMTDGQRRRRLRSAIAGPFGRRAVAELQQVVESVVEELLDQVVREHPDGRFDAVAAVGIPLTGLVITRILGIDAALAPAMMRWRDEVWRAGGDLSGMAPHPGMRRELAAVLDRCRSHPAPGLLTDLLQAQRDGFAPAPGDLLEDWEIVGQLAMMLWAAVGNTSGAVADALLFLTEFGCWSALAAEPELVPGAVEEVLRWYPSFPACYRLATEPITIGGLHIEPGATVVGWMTSAHRDPEVFADPDTFDIHRSPNPHLAFGHGSHGCVGAHLVRLQLRCVVRLAARRLPDLRRVAAAPPRRRVWLEDSLDELPLSFA